MNSSTLPFYFIFANFSNTEVLSFPPYLRNNTSLKSFHEGFNVTCLQKLNQWFTLPSMLIKAIFSFSLLATFCILKNFSALATHPWGLHLQTLGAQSFLSMTSTLLHPQIFLHSSPLIPSLHHHLLNFLFPRNSSHFSRILSTFLSSRVRPSSPPLSLLYHLSFLQSSCCFRWPISL